MGSGGERLPHDWDAAYHGTPPWDIGRPQAPFLELAASGRLRGRALDVGCGTGEHALLAAAHGCEAVGIDAAPTAIERAQAKATTRGLAATFRVGDVLSLDTDDGVFDTVLDCGFFHVLADDDRERFVDVLRRVLAPGGAYHMLCFSDRVPGDEGPRRIRRDEIRSVFGDTAAFRVEAIDEAYIEATFLDQPVPAWLARIIRDTSGG